MKEKRFTMLIDYSGAYGLMVIETFLDRRKTINE